ncbi:MAG: hypothetical protein Q9157_004293 [Trypethelium eluteriae]
MIDALLSRLIVLLVLSHPLSAYVSSVPYLTNSSKPTNKTSSYKALDPLNESPSASSLGAEQTTTLNVASSRPAFSTERDSAGGISLSSSSSSTLSTVNTGSPSPAKASSALVSGFNSTSTSILFSNEHISTTGTTLYHTSAQLSPNSSLSPTGLANVTGFVGNSSVDVEACFTQWSSFWSLSARDYTTFQSAIGGTTWFSSYVTSTTTYVAVYPTTSTSRGIDSETETEYAGAYPTATITTTWTYAYTYTYSSYVPGSTLTTTYEKSSEHGPSSYTTVTTGPSLTTPACQLPSVVPQCQSQWASYESLKLTDTSYNLGGLYDPPYALHGAAQAAIPASSDPWPSTTAASPAPAPLTVTPKPSATPPGASATSAMFPSLLPSSGSVGSDPSSDDPSANRASPSNGHPSQSEDPGRSNNPSSGGDSSPDGGAPSEAPSSGNDHDADQGSPPGNNPSSNSDSPSGPVTSGGNDPESDPSGNDPGTGDSGSTDPQRPGSGSASVPSPSSGHGSQDPAVSPIYSLASPQGSSIADGKGGSGIAAAIMSGIGGQPVDPTNDESTGSNAGPEASGDTSSASGSGTSPGIGGNGPEEPHQISGGNSNSGDGPGSSGSSSGSNTGHVNAGSGDPHDPSGAGDSGSEGQDGSSPDHPANGGSHAGSENPSSAGIGGGSLGFGNSVIQILTAQEADTPLARFTVDGSTFTAQSGQPVIVGSTILNAGGSAATVGNQVVSIGDSGVVVGTQTISYSSVTAPAAAIFTAGRRTYSAQAGKPLIVNGVTLSPGGDATTVDGQIISLGSSNVIAGTRTLPFDSTAALTASGAVITIDSSSLTAIDQNGRIVIGPETLSIGGAAATVAGETVSVASSGIVVDGVMHTFSQIPAAATSSNEFEASFSISGTAYTAFESPDHPSTAVILGANGIPTTISVGGSAVTIDGQAVSLNSDGVIVGTSSISFSSAPMTGTLEQEATFSDPAGHIHTAWEDIGGGNSAVLDGSVTLEVGGPAATVDGEIISLATGGLIINGTNTVGFAVATGPSSSGTTSGSLGGSETQGPSATGTQDPNVSSADRTSTADSAIWILGLEIAVVLLTVTFGT